MRKTTVLIAAIGLLAAACGGTSPGTAAESTTSTSVSSTVGPGSTTSSTAASDVSAPPTAPPDTAAPAVDGPPAPDFTLALADGTDFTLSAEQKPVYMVFWAEW